MAVVSQMDVIAATPLLTIVAVTVGLVSLAMVGAGIVMVVRRRGGREETHLKVLGATLQTQSVGAASVVCGLLLLLFVLRPLIQAVVDLAKLP